MFFVAATLSFVDPATFDLTTLSFIALILLLSLLSLSFIFHLRLKSRTSHHLQRFNSLWTVRFLLVSFISFWALNELLRLSFFLPSLPSLHQSTLCQIHSLLSLGLFQPCFLIILLFLINASPNNNNNNDNTTTSHQHHHPPIPFLLLLSFSIFLLHLLIVFYSPFNHKLPPSFNQSYLLIKHDSNNTPVFCSYPLLSSIAFAAFALGYMLCFFFSTWKVASMVINKSLRIRLYALAFTVMISLPLQIIFLGLSALWRPDQPTYSLLSLLVFLSAFLCATAGEGILVIVPIADSLAAGDSSFEDSGHPLKTAGDGS
ncbi:hypothetical protein Csa_014834 [Cucumis sativus]|uniref:THH1/TOM1/TOM3 domain-containing protein n=1 Tax=Cucumis sativus TaxID=3659 RepID=A0A0A0KXN9_CUCSA|nr:hypothetical protein Csa_014834 [Cucumis sativus]